MNDLTPTSSSVTASEKQAKPHICPTTLRTANDFVATYHRHSARTARNGGKFAIGCAVDGLLVGVAIVGNPVSATLMDGYTAEVLRLCVSPLAPRDVASRLYGACWQAWRAMGGTKLVTYTLQSEGGASLRASNMRIVGEVKGHDRWGEKGNRDGLDRIAQAIYKVDKFRWEIGWPAGKQKPHFGADVPGAAALAEDLA